MNRQIRQLGGFLLLLFVILFIQLNNVQVLQASKLANDPKNNRNAVRDFSTPRGVIQTADGKVIANSIPVEDDYKFQRVYPMGDLFGQLTGYFSFNYGNEGLEKTYNKDLTGKTYALKSIGDLLTDRVRTNNLTITASAELQQVAKTALGNRRGSVVALDPKTGAVLAMYSNPTYDPSALAGHDFKAVTQVWNDLNNKTKNPQKPMLPRSYRESFAPGSTFKLVTGAAAYDHKPELTEKRYPSVKEIALPNTNKTLANFGHNTCGGSIADLMRVSCNTGFAQMGMDLGGQNLSAEANSFGFNKVPPLDLPSVAKSNFPAADAFRRNQPALAYSAIGQQDVSATPLQMALVAAGIANNGKIMVPHLLKEVRDNNGAVVRQARPEVWLEATSEKTAEEMKKLMVNVANAGTATGARIAGVSVAAKTGTAQTGNDTLHAWLVSFAPADDPKVAVAVVLENQPLADDVTGGRLAAPIAQTVMKAALGIK